MKDRLYNAFEQRIHLLERLNNTAYRSIVLKSNNQATRMIAMELAKHGEYIELTRKEQSAIISTIQAKYKAILSDVFSKIDVFVENVALSEQVFTDNIYGAITKSPLTAMAESPLLSGMATSPINLSAGSASSWSTLKTDFTSTTMKNVKKKILGGIANNETNAQITSRICGRYDRRSKKYVGKCLQKTTRANIKTLVHTASSHYAAQARAKSYQANASIFESRTYLATFDSKTCPFCMTYSGTTLKLNQPYPETPVHPNSRSIWIMNVKGMPNDYGTRASKGAEGGQQVPATLSMNDWLHKQPDSWLKDTLPPWRYKLFKKGVPIDDFGDTIEKIATLKDFKRQAKNAKYFK